MQRAWDVLPWEYLTMQNNQLKALVERIEHLEAEKAAIGADIKEVYAEAKGSGFDAKILRRVVALRRLPEAEREEMQLMIQTYMQAL
jgi:uncharacterized protein (UPF0335 family)